MKRLFVSVLTACLLAQSALLAAPAYQPEKGERIAFVGGSLGERMNLYGNFEALLHSRFPQQELVIRNFARPADEVGQRQKPNDYTKIDDPLEVYQANTFICFFGYSESFAGSDGLRDFKVNYEKFIAETGAKYGKGGKAKFVLVSPAAFENANDPNLPNGNKENANLKLYTQAVKEVAEKLNLPYADVFTHTASMFNRKTGLQYTINGCHLNAAGDLEVAEELDRALFGGNNPAKVNSVGFDKLRQSINDKSWVHLQDYRMLNGWYVYGGRRTYDTETFPREYHKIRKMAEVRDRFVWDLVQGKNPTAIDDTKTGELIVPPTAFGTKSYSEPKELRYLSGEESIQAMKVADGFQVSLFASEEQFPELAKPVQINFDNKGRLWAACMPTYPQWLPGDKKPDDRLLIFEDTNNDGKADKCKVFYDKLHCPTGFEFWNGGVLVVSQPRILFLKDTDGDDQADLVVEMLDGWATDDTHHTVGSFEWSPGGLLHMLEGVAMSTTVETPWGSFRNRNTPGAYVVDPRSQKVSHFVTPGYGNPWCYVYNYWGQGIVGDGTSAQQHWDTPLSGAQYNGRRGLNPVFNNEGMRPVVGSEFLHSRHFPESVQGQFIYACVINMNGLTRFEVGDDNAGYTGKRIPDLLSSTDKNFRPTDPQLAPDGSLYFGDWCNALIGHMQYSQRDPNRDHDRGRIYRLTATGRPLSKPVLQYGKSESELLEQLKDYEIRTRYRARRELRDLPKDKVLAAVKKWVAKLDTKDKEYDRHLLEALWVQQGHHAVDGELLKKVLTAKTPEARAGAVHALADEWGYIIDPMGYLLPALNDEHARVRLEAVRALSFVDNVRSVELALEITKKPMDYWLDYTLSSTLGALQATWRPLFDQNKLAVNNPEGQKYVENYLAQTEPGRGAIRPLKILLSEDATKDQKHTAMTDLSKQRGNAERGKAIFNRICLSCHKVGNEGIDFGPNLSDVGTRLSKFDLVESIIEPNVKLDPKFLTTNIETKEGDALTGFVAAETADVVSLRVGGGATMDIKKSNIGKRETVNASSMPEGLAGALSPMEFLDLVEYLSQQKAK